MKSKKPTEKQLKDEMEKMEAEKRAFGRHLSVGNGESQAFWKRRKSKKPTLSYKEWKQMLTPINGWLDQEKIEPRPGRCCGLDSAEITEAENIALPSKKPEPIFEEWYGMEKADDLPQKIIIERKADSARGRVGTGHYEAVVIYNDGKKVVVEGFAPDKPVVDLVAEIKEYKK